MQIPDPSGSIHSRISWYAVVPRGSHQAIRAITDGDVGRNAPQKAGSQTASKLDQHHLLLYSTLDHNVLARLLRARAVLGMLCKWAVAAVVLVVASAGTSDDQALLAAAAKGDVAAATAALAAGAQIETTDQWGQTALLVACEHSHEEIAEMLVEKGANMEARNNHSSTVIMRAAMKGEHDVVKLLVAKGANVNAVNKAGISALSYAGHLKRQDPQLSAALTKLLEGAGAKRGDMQNRAGLHEMHVAHKSELRRAS